jgi:Domain of unknown function (DUF4328)/Protein of unknown function (DUF2510)
VAVAATSSHWRPTRALASWLTAALAIEAVVSLATLGQGTPRSLDGVSSGLDALLHGHDALAQTRFDHASDGSGFQVSQFVGWVAVVVIVLAILWQWRSQHNAQALGREGARISPGWGVAGWLIPLANLVIPYLVFQDLWRSSDEHSEPGTGWRSLPGAPLVSAWWVAQVVGTLAPAVVIFLVLATPRTAAETDWLTDAGSIVLAIACVLWIVVLRDITARQERWQQATPAPTAPTFAVQQQWGSGGPGWYPDPLHRFEHRYWDGAIWTEWVSTDGQLAIDTEPVPGYD